MTIKKKFLATTVVLLLLNACGGDDSAATGDNTEPRESTASNAATTRSNAAAEVEFPDRLGEDQYWDLLDAMDEEPDRIVPRLEPNQRMTFASTEAAKQELIDAIRRGDIPAADRIFASVDFDTRSELMLAAAMASGDVPTEDYATLYRFERFLNFNSVQLWQLDGDYINGRVVDAASGTPVSGASIRTQMPNVAPARSGNDGRFALLVPQRLAYQLTVEHPNYDTLFIYQDDDGGRFKLDELNGKVVELKLVAPVDVPVVDVPTRTLVGRVVDTATGQPVPGLVVGVAPQTATMVDLVSGAFSRETDSDGRFEIANIPGENVGLHAQGVTDGKLYVLQVEDFEFADNVERVIEIEARPVKLEVPVVVVGFVRDRVTGEPVANARVSAGGWKAERTDAEGRFLIQLDTGKDWQLTADHEAYHQSAPQPFASAEPKRFDTEFLLSPITTGTILGTAINSVTGEPIVNAVIEIAGQRIRTDQHGRFRAEEIESGEVTVSGAQSGYRADAESLLLEALQTAEATLELEPITTGTITGVVVDASSGAPLSGAAVSAGDRSTVTEADGRFVLEEVEAGTVDVAGSLALHLPNSTGVALEALATVETRLELTPITWGTVSGIVTDAKTGDLLVDATVRIGGIKINTDATGRYVAERVPAGTVSLAAEKPRYRDAQASIEMPRDGAIEQDLALDAITTGTVFGIVRNASTKAPIAEASLVIGTRNIRTDDQGRFRAEEIPAGRINLQASAHLYESESEQVVLEAAGETEAELQLVPITYGLITGTVTNKATGQPITNVDVAIGARVVRVDADGRFRAERVPAGTVSVSAELFRYRGDSIAIELQRGGEQEADLQLDPITTGTVRGVVRDASTREPLRGAQIVIGDRSATSAADGRFEIENVPAGDVAVRATATLFEPGEDRVIVEAAMSVDSEIELLAITFGTVNGRVVDDATGRPLPGARVVAGRRAATTDADGRFELEKVDAGSVTVAANKAVYLDHTITTQLDAGETESLTLRLEPITWGTVSGVVKDADTGRPLSNASVVIGSMSATTDSDGRFRAERVPAGDLRIGASVPAYESASTATSLAADGDSDVELLLEPIRIGDLRGRVVDAKTGEAVSGARVTVGRKGAETDRAGNFSFEAVDVGRAVVAARHPDYANGSASADVRPANTAEVTIRLDLRREDVTNLESELARSGTIDLYGIYFDSGKEQFKPSSLSTLRAVLEVMKRAPDRRFRIAGHTDSDGGDSYNQNLSERRAGQVIRWLVDNGIDAARLERAGFGETQPAAPNDTESGKALNRRVQLSFAGGAS